MLRKLAFGLGVAVGLFNLVSTAALVLTYYFTGRIPSMMIGRGTTAGRQPGFARLRPDFGLLTADELVEQVREQMRRRFAGR